MAINNLTRIQNNQITDSTIQAQAKIAAGSITGNLLASSVTFNSNITILGNLTVANSYTQLNSINTYINDPVVVFNNNYTGSLTNYDIGILVNRNLASLGAYGSVNTFLGWSEQAQAFIAVATTETGTAVSSINNSGYANVSIGNLVAVAGSFSGALTAPSMTVPVINATTGNITTLYAGNFSTANAQITGGAITNTSISGSTGYFTTAQATNFSSGNAVITGGYAQGLANVYATTAQATNFSTGNALITSGVATTLVATNFSSANAQITGGNISGDFNVSGTTGQFTNFSTGNALITSGVATTLVATNFSSANAQITGGNISGDFNVSGTTGQFTNFSTGNAQITGGSLTGITIEGVTTLTATNFSSANVQIAGGSINGTVIGNTTASSGAFTTLSTTGNLTVGGNIAVTGNIIPGANVTYSLGSSTNRFKDLWLSGTTLRLGAFTLGEDTNGNVTLTTGSGNQINIVGTTANTVQITGNVIAPYYLGSIVGPIATFTTGASITGTGTSTSTTTGALTVAGGVGIGGNLNVAGNAKITGNLEVDGTLTYLNTTTTLISGTEVVAGTLTANATTASTSTTTGALLVAGGAGIVGNLVAGAIQNTPIGSITPSTGVFSTLTATGNIVAASQTASTSSTTGAIVIAGNGGLGVGGNINAGVFNTSLHNIKGNVLLGQGSVADSADTVLTINLNTDTPIVSNTTVHLSSTTGKSASYGADTFGTGINSYFMGRRSRGTSTTPTAVQSGDGIVSFNGRGYGTTGYSSNTPAPGLFVYAGENFTDAAQGTGVNLQYTPIGTNTAVAGLQVTPALGNVIINSSTSSISPTTGALVANGGVGIGGNLNVAQGITAGLATFASINNTPIGNATPNTGAFSTLTATTATLTNFSTGNAQITGGSLTGITIEGVTTLTATNFATANAQIAGGSINGTVIGNATPAGATFTTLTASGLSVFNSNLVANSNTPSFSPTAGAIVIAGTGGLGVGGNINVAQTLFVGASHLTYSPQNAGIQFGASQNNFSQVVSQNANSGNNASTDFAAVANNGSDNDTYIDMGITGSGYVQSAYNLYGANDGYLVVSGNTTTGGGNLIINTYNANDIIFATGGTTKQFEVARITSGNVLVVKSTNNAVPAANTGAFQVWGGASVTSNVYIGGATTINGIKGAGNDVIVKGANDNTLIWARPNATYDSVIIGNSATASTALRGAKLQINSSDSMLLPVGTNAQRPSSTGGTDTQGMFRYNTTVQGVEWYTGTQWIAATTSFTVIADAQFTGTGSQTVFTLATAQTTASCIVSINGVVQIPSLAYSVSGTSLTFTEAPASTDIIDVRMLTTTATVTQISSTNGYMQFVVDNNGAYVYTGSVGTSATTLWNAAGAEVNQLANVTVATTGNTTIDSFSPTVYSSAEYLITSTISGTNIRELTKILVVTDGTNAYRTVYGVTNTAGNTLTTWSANVYSGSVTLWGASANANTIYRVKKNYQAI